MINEVMQVVEKKEIARNTYYLKLRGKIAKDVRPGQFLFLKVNDGAHILRRPISVLASNFVDELEIIFKVLGQGTAILKDQEEVEILGPLGKEFPTFKETKKVLLIGGGVGLPPLHFLGKENPNWEITSILGFLNKDFIYLEDAFNNLGTTYITTDDGSYGIKGLVVEALKKLDIADFDYIYICGPEGMVNYFAKYYGHMENIYVSLEEYMACGIGACLSCKREFKDGRKRICKEGPVFKLSQLEVEC